MELTPFVEAVVPSLTLQLVVSLLGFTAAVVVVTLLNLGRRVPPIAAALVAGPTLLLAIVIGELSGSWIATSTNPDDAIWSARAAFGGSMFTLFIVYLPSLLLAAGCAVAALRHGPRSWWFVGVGGVLLLVSALSPVLGAMMAGSELIPIGVFRSVLYAPIAFGTALALAAGAPTERAGPEAAAAAMAGWLLLYGAGETMASGRLPLLLVSTVPRLAGGDPPGACGDPLRAIPRAEPYRFSGSDSLQQASRCWSRSACVVAPDDGRREPSQWCSSSP